MSGVVYVREASDGLIQKWFDDTKQLAAKPLPAAKLFPVGPPADPKIFPLAGSCPRLDYNGSPSGLSRIFRKYVSPMWHLL